MRPPFDALLFDLDGTLVATDRFWVQAARTGARRAFDELGLERAQPSAAEWMRLVGLPLDVGFATLFADLTDEQRARVQACCVEEEHRLLSAGGAVLMPGAERTLDRLKATGVRMGIASNCSQAYLDHMWRALELGRWMETGRCLDSPGIAHKAGMLLDLMETFDTRSAVMIGDRATDGSAAHVNGLPFVFCRFGFAPDDEGIEAEGEIQDFSELESVINDRALGLAAVIDESGAGRSTFVAPSVLGVAGAPGSGATLFARDLARALDADFAPLAMFDQSTEADPLGLDFEAIERSILEPRARGEHVSLKATVADAGGVPAAVEIELDPARLLVVEAPGLLEPRLAARIDRLIVADASDTVCLAQLAGRDARRYGPGALERSRERLQAWRRLTRERSPERVADLIVDLANPLKPRFSESVRN